MVLTSKIFLKKREIESGEKIIRDHLLRENMILNNYSYCFLCPTNYYKPILQYKKDCFGDLTKNDVNVRIYEPNFIRKHLNVYLEGKWKNVMEIKNEMHDYLQRNRELRDLKEYKGVIIPLIIIKNKAKEV